MLSPKIFLCTILLFYSSYVIKAQITPGVQLPAIFSDNMVLQQKASIPVWGKAIEGTKIAVEIAGIKAETITQIDGTWRLKAGAITCGRAICA
jgi:hypothetical protein